MAEGGPTLPKTAKKKKTAKKAKATKKTKATSSSAATKKKAAGKKKEVEKLEIPAPDFRFVRVRIVGDSPLVQHKFSEKARKEIADKQQQQRTRTRGKRDPKAEYEAAMYVIKGKPGSASATYGMPATAFKRAMIDACRWIDGIAMTQARGAFHVNPGMELVPIKCSKPRMQEDVIRLPNGNADLRYRPYFDTWEVELLIKYNAGFIGLVELVNLLNVAGTSCGIGDRRPQQTSGDNHGMFHVHGTPKAARK
jgi:hypothetical protein